MDLGIWGLVIGIVGIVLAIIFYFLQNKKRELSWELISSNEIVTGKEEIQGNLKVLYNEREVHDVHLLEIKVMNTGDVGIPIEDYEQPITFHFSDQAEILLAEVIERQPDNLKSQVQDFGNCIVVSPALLNTKDYIVIKALVTGFDEKVMLVSARIKDVKEVTKGRPLEINYSSNKLTELIILCLVVTFGGIMALEMIKSANEPIGYFFSIGISLVTLMGVISVVRKIRSLVK